MWQGLQTITGYKGKHSCELPSCTSLPDELNHFYARFEASNTEACMRSSAVPGCVLRACAHQLAGGFTDIFNMSLIESVMPTCFKQTTVVPVPKSAKATCLNDYRPVALTSVAMKCFERLVMAYINTIIPETLDPLQFAYCANRSTDDVISIALHTALSRLDKRNTYVRMLLQFFSIAKTQFLKPFPENIQHKTSSSSTIYITSDSSCKMKHSPQNSFYLCSKSNTALKS